MRISDLSRCASGICAAMAILAGCGGSQSPMLGPTGFNGETVARGLAGLSTHTAVRAGSMNPDHRASWISPELKRSTKPVLFVSDDSTNDVYIYKLPTLKLIGTLTGFSEPEGECYDTKGNVWITNTGTQQIFEYSHKGVPENVLTDSVGYPVGCAWDSTTGNLAVTNYESLTSAGSVLVYAHASGSPTGYTNPSQYYYYFAGYDTKGNLFFDGKNATGVFMLSELPKGAAKAHTVGVIGGTIYFPGTVEWYTAGNYLIVGDLLCGGAFASCLYRVSIAHKFGTILGKIKLNGYTGKTACEVVQGTEWNNKFYGSDYQFDCATLPSTTYIWSFPKGKTPLAYSNDIGTQPYGAAVSK